MEVRENVPLSEFSNYKIGGPARFFAAPRDTAGIKEALEFARGKRLPVFILGGGTNILIPDTGYPGLVLKPEIMGLRREGNRVEASAGILMRDLLDFTVKESLAGFEWAGGLPGTVGGAVRGNAGCFGGETKDLVVSVTSMDIETGEIVNRKGSECGFSYRTSVFKEKNGRELILSTVFELHPGDAAAIRAAMDERIKSREEKHPLEYPNIGSIFKNVPVGEIPEQSEKELVYNIKVDPIPVIPAARIIDKAGLKGAAVGGAEVSLKHTNFIINKNNASAADVAKLMELIKSRVFERFGVRLAEEVERLDEKIKTQEPLRS